MLRNKAAGTCEGKADPQTLAPYGLFRLQSNSQMLVSFSSSAVPAASPSLQMLPGENAAEHHPQQKRGAPSLLDHRAGSFSVAGWRAHSCRSLCCGNVV